MHLLVSSLVASHQVAEHQENISSGLQRDPEHRLGDHLNEDRGRVYLRERDDTREEQEDGERQMEKQKMGKPKTKKKTKESTRLTVV
jgi:hypothetical protein